MAAEQCPSSPFWFLFQSYYLVLAHWPQMHCYYFCSVCHARVHINKIGNRNSRTLEGVQVYPPAFEHYSAVKYQGRAFHTVLIPGVCVQIKQSNIEFVVSSKSLPVITWGWCNNPVTWSCTGIRFISIHYSRLCSGHKRRRVKQYDQGQGRGGLW
jgi:hypothetical protein